jgi:nicotinamide riboside kinase
MSAQLTSAHPGARGAQVSPVSGALLIAVVGAESTGKTVLAQALATRINEVTGLRCAAVAEHLRAWCDREGRTPRIDEQGAIAEVQRVAIEAAALTHDVIVCDTTPLITAVYSRLLFGDDTLIAPAIAWQRGCAMTLLTALDLPWVADGHQRDGPQVQRPVDDLLRSCLMQHRLPWAPVAGSGAARVERALDAVAPLLRALPAPRRGLFTRLDERNAEPSARPWFCENCDDATCEHLTQGRQSTVRAQPPGRG